MENDNRITVGIADAEVLIRAGVRSVLHHAEEITVVGEAQDGSAAVGLVSRHQPRVLLMGTAMPGLDGLAAIQLMARDWPTTRVIVLAGSTASDLTVPALRAGAAGFLWKNTQPGHLVRAVRDVAAGDVALCPASTRNLIDYLITTESEDPQRACERTRSLTAREHEVLRYVAQGMSNAMIARTLWLSTSTVRAHVSRILAKLGCDSRVHAALLAHDAGLIVRRSQKP